MTQEQEERLKVLEGALTSLARDGKRGLATRVVLPAAIAAAFYCAPLTVWILVGIEPQTAAMLALIPGGLFYAFLTFVHTIGLVVTALAYVGVADHVRVERAKLERAAKQARDWR